MKEYIVSLMVISLICFVAKELSSSSSLSGHISFVSGICIFLVAIMPLASSIEKIREISFDEFLCEDEDKEKYEDIFYKYIENAQIDELKQEIRSLVVQEFDLDPSEVKVYVKFDSQSEPKLQRITVNLSGKGAFANSNEIKSYLVSRLECEVVVTVL